MPKPERLQAARVAVANDARLGSRLCGVDEVSEQLSASLRRAVRFDDPYPHWVVSGLLPDDVTEALLELPFAPAELGGVSGAREMHNNTRRYFDQANIASYEVCRLVAETFQDPAVVGQLQSVASADLDGSYLRIEFAMDTNGFWLRPHTDLGVKKLTLLYYLAADDQADLGTDVYRDASTWVKRAPCQRNAAVMFTPSDHTWHGFEPRPIRGVRRSVIINYVTSEWRAREQLAYPEERVRASSMRRTA